MSVALIWYLIDFLAFCITEQSLFDYVVSLITCQINRQLFGDTCRIKCISYNSRPTRAGPVRWQYWPPK
jgi:hypothetical protein